MCHIYVIFRGILFPTLQDRVRLEGLIGVEKANCRQQVKSQNLDIRTSVAGRRKHTNPYLLDRTRNLRTRWYHILRQPRSWLQNEWLKQTNPWKIRHELNKNHSRLSEQNVGTDLPFQFCWGTNWQCHTQHHLSSPNAIPGLSSTFYLIFFREIILLHYSDTTKIECTVDPVLCVGWRWRPQATGTLWKEAAEVNLIPEVLEKAAAV